MNTIEKAIEIALKAHGGQVDKAGKPYILHPLRMMQQLENDIDMIAAVLHDVLEDSDFTSEDLLNEGIPDEAVAIVQYLTRKPDETYEAFIRRAAENEQARRIKLCDLEDNMDILRIDTITEKDMARLVRYHKAVKYLKKS